MTAAKAYGTTWWGKRWLDALAGIDYENRIPRGKAYADAGRVQSFKIDEANHAIKARVTGNYDPFYAVKITLPPIPPEDVERLVDEMAESPLIVARLAARELSPEISDIADKLGIKIFPKSWTDLGMSCSCPDWAVPCKHIAAVIFKLSEEIDANPFILFTLRGVDLIAEMEKRGQMLDRAVEAEMPDWRSLIAEAEPGAGTAPTESEADDDGWLDALKQLTFTPVEEKGAALQQLFAETPPGYTHGSLRDMMAKVVAKAGEIAKAQTKAVAERTIPTWDEEKPFLSINTWGQPKADESVSWRVKGPDGVRRRRRLDPTSGNAFRPLYDLFSGSLTTKMFASAPRGVEALYDAWLIATRLVQQGAVAPQIYAPIEDFFLVRWIPAVMAEDVRELTARAGAAFAHVEDSFLRITGRPRAMDPTLLGELALSLFIQSYIEAAYAEIQRESGDDVPDHEALFGGRAVDTSDDAEAKAIGMRLESWTSPVFAQTRPHAADPVLIVHDLLQQSPDELDKDADDDVSVAVSVDDETAAEMPIGLELKFDVKSPGSSKRTSVALWNILNDKAWRPIRFDCLRTVSRLSGYCPELAEILRTKTEMQRLSLDAVAPILFEALPALKLLGVKTVLPRSLRNLLKPAANIEIDLDGKFKEGSGLFGLTSMMNFHWQLAVGDQAVTPEEFNALCSSAGRIVRFRDGYMYVTQKEVAQIKRRLAARTSAFTKAELLQAALAGDYENSGVMLSERVKAALKDLLEERPTPVPEELHATLRPYQERGYRWMMRNLRAGMGSIIADDMGLGKTLQVLSVLERLRADGELDAKPALVVVPATLLGNWQREAAKFAPKLVVNVFYGQNRDLSLIASSHVILTTYGVLRSSRKDLEKLEFRIMVIDEAQAIKNFKTAGFRAVRAMKSKGFIAMSGTPVENSLMEYWSVMEAANPGLLGTHSYFQEHFASPIENEHDKAVADRFKRITAPFILRRMKTDKSVISDLPEKVTTDEFCKLTKVQAALYQTTLRKTMRIIESTEAGSMIRKALVLQLIMKLKQICNAPAQYEPLPSYDDPALSGKMLRLFEILDEMKETGRKALIFTQFTQMGLLLQDWIEDRMGHRPQFIYGGLTPKRRQEIVDRFQKRRDENVLVLSLKAAGTGLNLTAASAVIHFDLWWNPAVENQATDRAYRIGQQSTVNVYRFICADTFEEKINELIESKKALVNLTVASGENWIGDLSNDELQEVFSLAEDEAEDSAAA